MAFQPVMRSCFTRRSASTIARNARVAVVGAGPSGLMLARLLQINNIPCMVFELDKDRNARTQGGSLDLHENSGRRALKKDAVVTIWKRLAAAELINDAQKHVHADADLMKVPKAEFMQEGYLQKMLAGAGFRDVVTETVSVLCEDEEIEGLRGFMLGDITRTVKAPWTDAEKEQWLAAVDRAIKEEVTKYRGVNFEAWVASGLK